MVIKDLTRGKYPVLTRYYKSNDEVSKELIDAHLISSELENFLVEHQLRKEDAIQLLDRVPVFLVESSMADEYVAVPSDECSIRVPADKGIGNVIDFDVDEWLEHMEDEEYDKRNDPREWECKGHIVSDLLGVYVFAGSDSVIPCRIFIWIDKIARYFKDNTKNSNDVEERTQVLYELVLRHEMMHALMDVAAYGIAPCPYFNYSNPIYSYIEEALANYMALVTCKSIFEGPHVNFGLKLLITSFVKNQGGGYAVGLDLFNQLCELQSKEHLVITQIAKKKRLQNIAPVWMHVKSQFNYEVAHLLAKIWKECLAAKKAYDDISLTTKELETQRTNAVLSLSKKGTGVLKIWQR